MGWGYYNYKPKKTAAQQRNDNAKKIDKFMKKNPNLSPISIEGRKIAKTWWGISWCKNLESYADYSNRIGRGSSYVRSGAVIDLQISEGTVTAMVNGTSLYKIHITIDPLSDSKWKTIVKNCAQRIESLSALVEGKFPEELSDILTKQGDGLFPSPREIHLDCSCPDWATMCKHVAAALYGVGARLDEDPLLFFSLRGVDPGELIQKSIEAKTKSMLANANRKSKRAIPDKDVGRIFKV